MLSYCYTYKQLYVELSLRRNYFDHPSPRHISSWYARNPAFENTASNDRLNSICSQPQLDASRRQRQSYAGPGFSVMRDDPLCFDTHAYTSRACWPETSCSCYGLPMKCEHSRYGNKLIGIPYGHYSSAQFSGQNSLGNCYAAHEESLSDSASNYQRLPRYHLSSKSFQGKGTSLYTGIYP